MAFSPQRHGVMRCRRWTRSPRGNSTGAAITADTFDLDHPESFLLRVAHGDHAAFQAIHQATAEGVFRAAMQVLRNPQQAEEVTQDVFLHLWNNAHRYDASRGCLQAWLHVIAHHRAVDQVRSQQRRREREHRADPLVEEAFELDVLGAIAAGVLRQMLARLTPDHRTVLLLAYFGGYSHSEIARTLDTPLGTVKTRIRDAKLRLRTHLERHPCTRGLFDSETEGLIPATAIGQAQSVIGPSGQAGQQGRRALDLSLRAELRR